MKVISILSFLLAAFSGFSQNKQVCFTYDDLPFVAYGNQDSVFQQRLTSKLVAAITKNKIPATAFVNETKLFDRSGLIHFQEGLLRTWVDHGLDLGNHTFAHPDYNNLSFFDFSRGVLKGETITKRILASKGKKMKYFRHPFLHVGDTKPKADSLTEFLTAHGYTIAPVTIDNEDYVFAVSYQRTKEKKDDVLASKIGHDYLSYMEKKIKYYERQSKNLFGRDMKQILLLHASWLNADYTDSLAMMFNRNNYEFISLDEALKDKLYETPVTVFGKWGISWLDRWAMSAGKKGDFFKDEPATPDYVTKLSE